MIILFFAVLFKPFQNHLFNLDLGDENDNFATGQWINNGKIAYKDFFLQHQPNPTLISALIQKSSNQNTTFLLVKRHREFIYFFSLIFILLLAYRFGLVALISGVFIELSKFTILGNLFLAESLVIYPMIYLSFMIFNLYLKRIQITYLDLIITTFCVFFIGFNLAPTVVFIFLVSLLFFLKLNAKFKIYFIILLGTAGFLHLLIYVNFISFSDYFYQTFYINLFKFIPFESTYSKFSPISILILPIQSIFFENNSFYFLLKTVSTFFILSLVIFYRLKMFSILFLELTLLVSVNLRPVGFGLFGQGFHYLPYYSILITITIYNLIIFLKIRSNNLLRYFSTFCLIVLSFLFFFYGYSEFSQPSQPFDRWYVHYSGRSDYSKVIKELASKNSQLLAMPQESLLYWESGLQPSSKFFFTLNIMYSEDVIDDVKANFSMNKPDFWYLANDTKAIEVFGGFFGDYIPIKKGRDNSFLMIKKSRFREIEPQKWEAIKAWGFEKPDEI